MLNWLLKLFGDKSAQQEKHELLVAYETALATRLHEYQPLLEASFQRLFSSEFPLEMESLHIEIHIDEPGFSFCLHQNTQSGSLHREAKAVTDFNTEISEICPIFGYDEYDQYMIWEPNEGSEHPQVALHQPIDALKISDFAFPWFRNAILKNKKLFDRKITIGIHDHIESLEL